MVSHCRDQRPCICPCQTEQEHPWMDCSPWRTHTGTRTRNGVHSIAVLNSTAWTKGTRARDLNGYTFKLFLIHWVVSYTKYYSKNNMNQGKTSPTRNKASAAVTNLSWLWCPKTQHNMPPLLSKHINTCSQRHGLNVHQMSFELF